MPEATALRTTKTTKAGRDALVFFVVKSGLGGSKPFIIQKGD
jgi:hypothetical protein